mmetsp:Transcript_39568/g.93178  ORF Transcript_39568/g.93178 Transcript_39568/m.93178 type:complete len:463 (+) Transcript_39568:44-1432(+)
MALLRSLPASARSNSKFNVEVYSAEELRHKVVYGSSCSEEIGTSCVAKEWPWRMGNFTARQERMLLPDEVFQQASEAEPQILQKSIYNSALKEAFFKADQTQRMEMFVATLQAMTAGNAFDHTEPRLWSFAHHAIYSVQPQTSQDHFDRSASRIVALESIIAGHLGSHGIGPLLQLLTDLMNTRLDLYTRLKVLEIEANALEVSQHECYPKVTINLRASDWMLPEVVAAVRAAHSSNPGRMVFEFTEYSDDAHFDRFFPDAEGRSLDERLEAGLLPLFQQLTAEGIELWADDVKPSSVYIYEDAAAKAKGVRLRESHCTVWELVRTPRWRQIFTGFKLSIDFLIHALEISKDSGPDFAKVPIHAFNVKRKPEHIAAVQGEEAPSSEEEAREQLLRLQSKALESFREICLELGSSTPLVLEATLPAGSMHLASLQDRENFLEQGGLMHEAKLPPLMYIQHSTA